jgi:hypothetical protein
MGHWIYDSQYATIDSFTNKKIRIAINREFISLKKGAKQIGAPEFQWVTSYAAQGELQQGR